MITGALNLDLLIRLRNGCKNRPVQYRKNIEFILPKNYAQMTKRASKNALNDYRLKPDDCCNIAQNIINAWGDTIMNPFKSRF